MTDDSILCHERLAIVGVGSSCSTLTLAASAHETLPKSDTGAQPLVNEDGSVVLAVNGEIYNHRTLRRNLQTPATFKTHSDCEVIMHLVRSPFLES